MSPPKGILRGIHVLISRALRTREMHLNDTFIREPRTKKGNIQKFRAFDCIRECQSLERACLSLLDADIDSMKHVSGGSRSRRSYKKQNPIYR